jgi:hypothetical protein
LSLELLEERKTLTADIGLAEPAPVFTIGEGVCSAASTSARLDAPSVDAAFTDEFLAAEGEQDPPVISNFFGEGQGAAWSFSGVVSDDGPVEGLPVYISFNGNYQGVVYTEAGGLFTFTLDAGNDSGIVEAAAYDSDGMGSNTASYLIENLATPSQIQNFTGQPDQGGMWLFSGVVLDDEEVGGLSVIVSFNGNYQGTATTASDGSFSLAVYIGEEWGTVDAIAYDMDGMASEPASYLVS